MDLPLLESEMDDLCCSQNRAALWLSTLWWQVRSKGEASSEDDSGITTYTRALPNPAEGLVLVTTSQARESVLNAWRAEGSWITGEEQQ